MPDRGPTFAALAERNKRLSQTRIISLGIAGGAALASLGLGTAFAHAIPGHHHTPATQTQTQPAQPGGGTLAGGGQASSSAPAHSSAPVRKTRPGHHARRHHHAIAPPTKAPAPAPSSSSPPPVSSGGS